MASEEEDFPRGGTARKSSGSKIVVEQVENLFQVESCVPPCLSKIVSRVSDDFFNQEGFCFPFPV